jgi:hypothetical protein
MLTDLINDYDAATSEFLEALNEVTSDNIDRREPGGWSARQVIHHCADSEAQSYARLRRLLAEPSGSSIQGYDEALWAASPQLGYESLPVDNSVAVFRAVRESSLMILRGITEEDLERTGVHTESGPYSLALWLDIYTRHPREHAAQLRRALLS